MVVILNHIPVVMVIIAALCVYRVQVSGNKNKIRNSIFAVAICGFSIYLYQAFQPSYMPKGVVYRSAVPQFEVKETQLNDNLKKPVPGEERDKKREEEYKKPLPFVEK